METIYIRRSKGVISGAVGGGEGVEGNNLSKGPGLGMWTGGGPIGVKRFLVLLLLRKERKSPRHDGRCWPPFVLLRLSPWTPFPHSQHPLFCHLPCTWLTLNNLVPALCLSDWAFPLPEWFFPHVAFSQHSALRCELLRSLPYRIQRNHSLPFSHSAPIPHLAYFLYSLITAKIIQCAGLMPVFPY